MARLEKLEGMSSLVRTQASRSESQPGDELSYFGRVMLIMYVPELGVMGVHEHVQPLQEEFRIRTHVDKVCPL